MVEYKGEEKKPMTSVEHDLDYSRLGAMRRLLAEPELQKQEGWWAWVRSRFTR